MIYTLNLFEIKTNFWNAIVVLKKCREENVRKDIIIKVNTQETIKKVIFFCFRITKQNY